MIEGTTNLLEAIHLIELAIISKDIWLGCVGGFISYIYDYKKFKHEAEKTGKENTFKFTFGSLLTNMALGSFIGYCAGMFLDDIKGRDAMVAFSGVFAYNILYASESKLVTSLMDMIIKKKM